MTGLPDFTDRINGLVNLAGGGKMREGDTGFVPVLSDWVVVRVPILLSVNISGGWYDAARDGAADARLIPSSEATKRNRSTSWAANPAEAIHKTFGESQGLFLVGKVGDMSASVVVDVTERRFQPGTVTLKDEVPR